MQLRKLSDVCEIIMGQSPESSSYNENGDGLPFFQGKADFGELNPIPRIFCSKPSKTAITNDVLMSVRAPVGDVNIASEECCIGRGLAAIRSKENIHFKYLYYVLEFMKERIAALGTGSTFKAISKAPLSSLEIPVPSLDQQIKVVNVIDKVKYIINNRQSQITALDELTQSVFLEMFGDPKTNKNGYPIESLTYFYEHPKNAVKCGPFGSALKKDEYVNEGIPVWNMDNITKQNEFIDHPTLFVKPEKAESLKNYNVKKGDIIISRAGTVGKMAIVESKYDNSLISTNLIRLRLNEKLKPEFLVWLIKIFGDKVCRMRTGNDGSFTHMNTSILNSIEFPYPPLEKQEEFINKIIAIKSQKQKLIEGLNEMSTLYNSLLQKVFKGELFQG